MGEEKEKGNGVKAEQTHIAVLFQGHRIVAADDDGCQSPEYARDR